MVNFRDPDVLFAELLALIKFTHVVNGIYIWEFVSNLDYEWGFIRGHHPHQWTIWIYFVTRLATLMAVIMNLVDLNLTSSVGSCQVLTLVGFSFAYMAFSLSSLLIVLRIIAIWNRNKPIVGLAIGIWAINTSILIHGLTQIRSSWDPEPGSCSLPNIKSQIISVAISMFTSDSVLLLIMFVGLVRLRHRSRGTFGLVRLLWKQGVIYLLVATAAELPPLVFICLDLNWAFDMMFLMPALIAMSISATRMYRSLIEGFYDETGKGLDSPPSKRVGRTDPNAEWTTTTPSLQNGMEVSVHSSYKQWQPPATQTDPHVSFIDTERQMSSNPRGIAEK